MDDSGRRFNAVCKGLSMTNTRLHFEQRQQAERMAENGDQLDQCFELVAARAEIERLRAIENAAMRVASSFVKRNNSVDPLTMHKLDFALENQKPAHEPSEPHSCQTCGFVHTGIVGASRDASSALPEEQKALRVQCICGWQGKVGELTELSGRYLCPECVRPFEPMPTLRT